MRHYRISDREVVFAATSGELVEKLRATSMAPVGTCAQFRERAAHWAKELYQAEVRTDNDDDFVADMVRHGVWSVEPGA